MNQQFKVYLAGAIAGLNFGEATDWREDAKRKLATTTYYDAPCRRDTDGDGDCPGCAHGNLVPFCRERTVETGIVGYSPMRAKDYLKDVGVISGRPDAYDDLVLSSAKGIAGRDAWDVKTADLILINLLGTTKISEGTVLEVGMGHALGKPMVACMETDNIHHHPMFDTYVPWIVDDLNYAIDIVKAILLPDGVKVPA